MLKSYRRMTLKILASKSFYSLSISITGNILISVFGFITSILVLRRADTENIALIYPLLGILMITEQLSDLGLSNSLIQVAASLWNTYPAKALNLCNMILKIRGLLTILVVTLGVFLSKWISLLIFKTPDHSYWVKITILICIVSLLNNFHINFLQITSQFKKQFVIRVLPHLSKMLLLLFCFYTHQLNFNFLFFGFFLVPFFSFALSILVSDFPYLRNPGGFTLEVTETLHLSKWILISTLCVSFMGQIDLFMLRSLSSPEELARYMGGSRLASVFMILNSSLVAVLLPKVSAYQTKHELRAYFLRSLKLLPIILVLTLIAFILAPAFIHLTLSQKYDTSIPVFRTFFIQFGIDLFITPISLILYKLHKAHLFSILNFIQLFLFSLMNFLLIPSLGAQGVALSGLSIRVFALFFILWIFKKNYLNAMSWHSPNHSSRAE